MFHPKPGAILLCAAAALGAQAPVDLNGLVAAAKAFTSHGLQGQSSPPALDLRLLRGDNGGDDSTLMGSATDVQRWAVFYDASYQPGPDPEAPERPASASLTCLRGVFSDFALAKAPIPDVKSMEFTWIALGLDAAVAQLNANGFVRGFSEVEVKRPDLLDLPDEPAYVFTCPWERRTVAISTSTGALVWSEPF